MIPRHDNPEFAQLPDRIKKEITLWEKILEEICRAEKKGEAIRELSLQFSHIRGFSEMNIRRKYNTIRRTNDWRCLINHSKHPGEKQRLPAEFIEFWKSLCEKNQRNSRPAHRELIRRWEAGMDIPGYADLPSAEMNGLPRGWTYRNLMRHAPTKFELTARRKGRSAAAKYRPLVFTTRAGLKVGQYYIFDDLEHDIKVNVLGINRQAMRPLELCALDLVSGCKIAWGMKPTIENDGKKEKLKEREMRFLLAHILTNIGYRKQGTILMVEHGTAAIRPDIEEKLLNWTDGAITINRSGIQGAAAFAGMYEGRGKGNPRFKAALESHHNLVHNELAALPGQMGKDRDSSPEELHGREKHNNALIRAMAALPAERVDLLRLPFLEYNQFASIVTEIYRLIDRRTEHDLEGWIEAGFVENEFRLDEQFPWQPLSAMLALPPEKQTAIEALIERPGLSRTRRLSPWEVWSRNCAELVKLPGWIVPELLGPDYGCERRLKKNTLFEFEDRELGPGTHRYEGILTKPDGTQELLKPDEAYFTHVNPFNPEELYISAAGLNQGAYLGVCRRWHKVQRDDLEALHRQMGRAAKIERKLLEPVAKRGAEIIRHRLEDARWNARVLSGAPVLPHEKARDQFIKNTSVSKKELAAVISDHDGSADDDYEFSNEEIAAVLSKDEQEA